MKLPFFKKKTKELPEGYTRQQIIPKGVSSVVRPKEEIYKTARMRTRVPEEYSKIELREDVAEFLRRHNACSDQIDRMDLTMKLHAAMEAGLRGEKGGLAMIPTYLTSMESHVVSEEPVAVLDAGGSNLRVARVIWDGATPLVEEAETIPLPGSTEPVTWSKFIKQCADLLEPRLDGVKRVGICFCYPAEATPEGDLKVLSLSKEVTITGCKGKLVCASLNKELEKRGHEGISYTALNDTAAALIRGRTSVPPRYGSDFAGMVMGTGVNAAISLPVERIEKLGLPADGTRMIVDMEAGFFSDVPQSDFEKLVDEKSEAPGVSRLEKMIGGRYLGDIARFALKAAAEENMFEDEQTTKRLKNMRTLSIATADKFADDPWMRAIPAMKDATEKDLTTAQHIIIGVLRRAGAASTCLASAIAKLSGQGLTDRYKPVIVSVDGSVYNKSFFVHEEVTEGMQEFAIQELNIFSMCKGVEHATLIGTACAAVTEQHG